MLLDALQRKHSRDPTAMARPITAATSAISSNSMGESVTKTNAMKLTAVNRCVEILSDSMAKLPCFVMDGKTKQHLEEHPILPLLTIRPNEGMTPSAHKKMLEANRLMTGNSYDWIVRDPKSGRPVELIPVPGELVQPFRDTKGHMWYFITNPVNGQLMTLPGEDVCHFKAFSYDGITGISVLSRAADVIRSGRAAQQYASSIYENAGTPSGVLTIDTDLNGTMNVTRGDGKVETVKIKDEVRREWEKAHAGPANAHRVAILDMGMKYQPISISPKDVQFVESTDVTVQDIARAFGVPLYKLQSGKQAYSSNEQNAIEYIVGTLHPIVTGYEEEWTWKLLNNSEIANRLEIRMNMMAELKGDFSSRANWYKTMREIGVFSPNDICALEDIPDVPGGNSRYASWNYGPLDRWEDLSVRRNGGEPR